MMSFWNINLDRIVLLIVISALSILFLPHDFLIDWQWVLIMTLPLLCILLVVKKFQYTKWVSVLAQLVIILLCLGYFHAQCLALLNSAKGISDLPEKIEVDFDVVEILNQQAFQSVVIETKLQPHLPKQKIYVNWKLSDKPKLGERWRGTLHLRTLASRLNQGGFDRQQWYLSKGITAYATLKSAVLVSEDFSWRQRRLISAHHHTEHLSQQGLLLALGFGERAWLDSSLWTVYQKTNTAHLIAISGSHIALIMFIAVLMARVGQFFLPTRWIEPLFPLLFGGVFALLYSDLAGFTIPTFRAIVALLILCFCRIYRVYWTAWQLLFRVLAFLLICDPFMLLSASFWLSVGAVVCLIVWYQCVPLSLFLWQGKPIAQSSLKKVRYFLALFHLQFGLFWLFTPVQLLLFNGFSLTGFGANLIVIPFFSVFLIPTVLFATMTDGLWQSWWLANEMAFYINRLIIGLDGYWIPISDQTAFIATGCLFATFAFALKWIEKVQFAPPLDSTFLLNKRRKRRFSLQLNDNAFGKSSLRKGIFGAGLGCFCSFFMVIYQQVAQPSWRIETLDVGQGLATLIVQGKQGVLYDTGAGWEGGNIAKLEILPYLIREGIELETLILSHDDNDHAGGAKEILRAYPNLRLVSSSHQNYGETYRTFCRQGESWQWGKLFFQALSPNLPVERADNPDSCVLLVTDGKYSILLTGDADVATELQFIASVDKVDILQVGHHGSKTSTGSRLVNKLQPQIALISSGRWNPWGFPHPSVVERLNRVGSTVYNTGEFGQISLLFTENEIKVKTARAFAQPWFRELW